MRIAQPYDHEAAGLMCAGAKRRERSGVAVDALLLGYGTCEPSPDVPLMAVGTTESAHRCPMSSRWFGRSA